MKTIIIGRKVLAVIMVCLFSLTYANAQEATIDGLHYFLFPDTHEATLNHDNDWQGDLVIPSEVNYKGETYTVSGISDMAFIQSKELTKVRIPKTIDHVEHGLLTDEGYNGDFPDYWMNPFQACTALESIEVDEDNPIFKAIDGILFNKDGTRLYCYPGGIRAESYTVPDSVTWIGNAFGYNEYLVTVKLPESVENLYTGFSGCTKLEEVSLPKNLTFINDYMFSECPSLKSIEIPSGVNRIAEGVFRNCSSLESVVLPESVSAIGNYSFSHCTSLETIVIPVSLSNISNGLFLGCSNLKRVVIPDGVGRVSLDAFDDCSSLKELDLPASVTDIPGPAFRGCKFDNLIIRGNLGLYMSRHIFDGMETSATIYTLASQVKEFQEIYDGVVLPLEKYTSDIQPTKYSSANPSTAYDLQGRRLTGEPGKGIYIQNGRKMVAK